MVPMEIKRAQIDDILNKAPGDTVTATEWNAILDLLVTQTNYLSTEMVQLDNTMVDILTGKVPHIEVDMNVTEFDGHPSSYYAKTGETAEALEGKQDTINTTAARVLITDGNNVIKTGEVHTGQLDQLKGLDTTKTIQTQLNGKLGTQQTAQDTARINGKPITVSQTQPTTSTIGHVWISW